jgi:hypothetical protein
MTPTEDMPMKVKDKVSHSYVCTTTSKNLMLPNVVAFNMLRNNDDDDVDLRKTPPMVSTIDGTWIQHALDPIMECKLIKVQYLVC